MRQKLRNLPAVHRILELPSLREAIEKWGHRPALESCRQALDESRHQLLEASSEAEEDPDLLMKQIETRSLEILLHSQRDAYPRLINATGVLLHTNLGRAPAFVHPSEGAYLALEFDLNTGKRGQRLKPIQEKIARVCGAEDALMVNNNAASLLLILQGLALGREVIVSRSQLIEIGGSFRLPDVMEAAGCRLVEVGCTNRTHLEDFEEALGENTAAILIAHQSNFRIHGFTASPEDKDLAALAHKNQLPFVVDQGSGCLYDLRTWGLPPEKTVSEYLKDGADLVCFSGDKLLGGPQAGLIVGKREWVEPLGHHPLYRALRPGKLSLSAMDQVLRAHQNARLEDIPLYAMLSVPVESLKKRAQALKRCLKKQGISVEIRPTQSTLGGGTTPGAGFPSVGLSLEGGQSLLDSLRAGAPPVIGCLEENQVILDLRSVPPADDALLERVLLEALGSRNPQKGT